MSKNKDFPAGTQVRVRRDNYHGIKFGAVCTVVSDALSLGDVLVSGPTSPGWNDTQYIDLDHVKLAKQANKRNTK